MRAVLLALLLAVGLALTSGTAAPKPKSLPTPYPAFFFANNDSLVEAVATYAEMLCIHDHQADASPAAFLAAARLCADSYRDELGEEASNDGAWLNYRQQALAGIRQMCEVGATNEDLCGWTK